MRDGFKILLLLAVGIALGFGVWFLFVLSVFAGYKFWVVLPLLILFCVGYIWFFLRVLHSFSFKKPFFLMLICVLILGSYIAYTEYIRSIPIVHTHLNLHGYKPFGGGLTAKLDEPSTLTLSSNLPRIDGATALYPIYAAFVQAVYPKNNYDIDDENSIVQYSKTAKAYKNLIDGKTDMIFAAAPSKEQVQTALEKGLKFNMTPIGKEAFVFFVNSKNSVDNLKVQDIKDIYSGKIKNWREVGGKSGSIKAFQRPKNSGSQTALERIMGQTPIMDAPREDRVKDMGGIINQVADYRNFKDALGYSFLFFATNMVTSKEIKLLHIDGVEPNHENIRSGKYPFASEFYVITVGNESEETLKFIEWMKGAQAKKLIEKTGYVAIN
ncbi:PstS family phosphate ABC transporter substrate-binding protein [Campylobacter sp.]|uniref:PstS family phosphate ABC transporter substrate-binding protein n=1 Tax=Campylobacter sp. TaxID=205 RepID=UPI0026F94506|nr:substrate-binding domain-containing protein [Campylobacter sp.]